MWVPEDPRKTLASDPAGQWLALLEHGPVKCSPGQDLPRVPAFEESWASEEENEGDSKEGVHAPSTDSPQAATRGASEAPEKDAQTRNLEIEADMATATEHAAPGGEAPVEEANPEDGVHEAGIANQTAANMMKQAQDDDGKQADEADDELSRKAATTAHAAAAAGEEATPCSEHDSDAGIATVTTAEAASGKARSNAQENAAVRLARLFQAPAPEAPEVPEPPEPGQRGRRLHTRARKSDPVQLAIAAGADEGFARAAAQKRRAAASNDEAARPKRGRGKAKDEEQSNRTIRTRQTVSWRCFVCDGGPSGKLGCLIRCDGCDKTFHMNCHDPPVTRPGLPNEKWYCSHCTEALAQHRALRLRPGDFAWARLKATSVLWPCVVLKLDFTKLDDPRPYWVNFFEGRKREQRGAWVGEEQVLQWSDGPMIPESASQRQAALRQAQAAGAGLFGTERCSPPETPRRKVTKVRSPGSGGTTTSSTTLPHSSPHAGTPSSRRPSHPNLKQEAQKIQALLQEAQQRQRRLEARLSTPSPYSTPNSV